MPKATNVLCQTPFRTFDLPKARSNCQNFRVDPACFPSAPKNIQLPWKKMDTIFVYHLPVSQKPATPVNTQFKPCEKTTIGW